MATKYRIEYISTFYDDVVDVTVFLDQYPNKAARIYEKLDRSILRLKDNPKMYRVYQDFPFFRVIVVEDYLAFYTVDDEKHLVEIHRLLYGGMDIPAQLSSDAKLYQ